MQKGDGSEQLNDVGPAFTVQSFAGLDESGGAFMDTAAIMRGLDLVVTSDTATAHLAGGLGVPVWVVLSKTPEWRWFQEREDSPWYPTMRLFRQRQAGDWDDVFAHGRTTHSTHDEPTMTTLETLQQAYTLHRAGDIDRAEQLYRDVLAAEPANAQALHLSGVIAHQRGHYDKAAELIERAISVDPSNADYFANKASVELARRRQAGGDRFAAAGADAGAWRRQAARKAGVPAGR